MWGWVWLSWEVLWPQARRRTVTALTRRLVMAFISFGSFLRLLSVDRGVAMTPPVWVKLSLAACVRPGGGARSDWRRARRRWLRCGRVGGGRGDLDGHPRVGRSRAGVRGRDDDAGLDGVHHRVHRRINRGPH